MYFFKVPHAGDLIALGSKSSAKLRHSGPDVDDTAKTLKTSNTLAGGNPPKKFKPATSGETSGGLFSDPIRVTQASQQLGSSGKPGSSKVVHGKSPQPVGVSTTQQIIEGVLSFYWINPDLLYLTSNSLLVLLPILHT